MKVTNWRSSLAATLVAVGMISPAAARAANLDVNLVVNPGFESVDNSFTGDYGAPKVNDWMGTGFAYSHNPAVTGIPDYADGTDPPNAGNWYFTANNQPESATGDVRAPDVIFQDIAVNSGPSGAQIAAGEAAALLRAQMSSYFNDNDFGIVHLQFRNAAGTTLGTLQISDADPGPENVWSLNSAVGFIPPSTTSIRASLFGGVRNGGTDGYIDNVDVQVTNAANVLLFVEVNATSGEVSLRNLTGQPVAIDYYEITSPSSALNRAGWSSLQDQNLAGFPAGGGAGNGWEEGGGGGDRGLSESHLTGSSLVTNGADIGIGAAFTAGGAHDLVFRYGVVGAQTNDADFDADGDVDGADFLRWQRGFGAGNSPAHGDADGDNDVDADDLAVWRSEFGATAFGGPSTLVQGFVRYLAASATPAPEPASVLLVGLGLGFLPVLRKPRP